MKYQIFASIVACYMIVEISIGIVSNSTALQTDGFHMLSDLIALIVAGVSEYLAKKGTTNIRYSYGLKRSETLGGFFNSCFLLTNIFWLLRENIDIFIERSKNLENVELGNSILLVLIVSILGLLLNILGIKIFHVGHDHGSGDSAHGSGNSKNSSHSSGNSSNSSHNHNHNHTALMLHLIIDLLGSIVVVISSSIIISTDWRYKYLLDPIGSCLIILMMIPPTVKNIIGSGKILMHKSSKDIDIEALTNDIKAIEGVTDLHELHVWAIDSNINIASMHIKTDKKGVITPIKELLHSYNIHSSSIQRERGECIDSKNCGEHCGNKRCCEGVIK
jgi:cation diffusion facilitator family transporter